MLKSQLLPHLVGQRAGETISATTAHTYQEKLGDFLIQTVGN